MIYAVICEFNPFHNGHRHLLARLPKKSTDYIVCIMSGAFVQRGEPAAFDKWSRAAAAVSGGADLVLELPAPFVLADGDRFAEKGVETAAALGMPVTLAFGMESASAEPLTRLAAVSERALSPALREGLEAGLSYGAARQRALSEIFPEESALLMSPNNLLACGYIRACLSHGCAFLGFQRTTAHDGGPQGTVASASYIRRHPEDFLRYCPQPQQPALDFAVAHRGILTLLKAKTAAELRQCANISEGLENRIIAALAEEASLPALYDRIKTRRYSHAKIRRAVMCAALGIPQQLPKAPPPYLRVLAFGPRGRDLMRQLPEKARLPLLQTGRACARQNPAFFQVERLATDLWNCWSAEPRPGGMDYRKGAVYVSH